MSTVEIYVLLEYSAIITILAGLVRWKHISSFLKMQIFALFIMLIGDFVANTSAVLSQANAALNFLYDLNIESNNNIPIYFISYPLSLAAIIFSWIKVPEYRASDKKGIYVFSIGPIVVVLLWSIFQGSLSTPMFFQDYALIGLLHTAVLLILGMMFFHIFLNTEVFEPQLKNPLFVVACAHIVFAVPSTFIILFSEIYDREVATDIWLGREVAYCISNLIIVLALFVKE